MTWDDWDTIQAEIENDEASLMRLPNDRGQGRKPLSPTGELMKPRQIRMLDSEWEDAKFIGPQEVRELIVKRAKKLRAIDKATGSEA